MAARPSFVYIPHSIDHARQSLAFLVCSSEGAARKLKAGNTKKEKNKTTIGRLGAASLYDRLVGNKRHLTYIKLLFVKAASRRRGGPLAKDITFVMSPRSIRHSAKTTHARGERTFCMRGNCLRTTNNLENILR